MVSIGFLLMPRFQHYIIKGDCEKDDDCYEWLSDHQEKCLPMSLWLEFFQIASESWLFCITYDLVVTIINPFASFSYRYIFFNLSFFFLLIINYYS